MNTAPVLEITGLSGGYSLNKPVLHDIGLQVQPGEMVGLIGLNGAGKSTTMKHILGLMSPHKGEITVKGKTRSADPEVSQRIVFCAGISSALRGNDGPRACRIYCQSLQRGAQRL